MSPALDPGTAARGRLRRQLRRGTSLVALTLGAAALLAEAAPAFAQDARPAFQRMRLKGGAPGGTVGPASSFRGIRAPARTAGDALGRPNLRIEQIQPKAVVDWDEFSIERGESVDFTVDRSLGGNAGWVVLNRVGDGKPAAEVPPSEILGAMRAEQQLYLINPNGIVFGNGAQVNAPGLVASTLRIADDQFERGLGSAVAAGTLTEDFRGDAVGFGEAGRSEVRVDAGAVLQADAGGRVLLFGRRVLNAGTIETPEGQALLAAGGTIYLAVDAAATSGTDDVAPRSTRLLVAVNPSDVIPGVTVDGEVANTGRITARRGDVTLAGLLVRQAGTVEATTSVDRQGTILLKAADQAVAQVDDASLFNPGFTEQRRGALILGPGSVTRVTPDAESASRTSSDIAAAAAFRASAIELRGQTVRLQAGAAVAARGGTVTIEARPGSTASAAPGSGVVEIEAGASIDVSGTTDTVVDGSRNFVRGLLLDRTLLAPSPGYQRDFLDDRSVSFDLRRLDGRSLRLAATAGQADAIERTVNERLARGGGIAIDALGDVVIREGAVLDLRGGRVTYGETVQATTRLARGTRRSLVPIETASAYGRYRGLLDSDLVFQPGYDLGTDGGSLAIAIGPGVADDSASTPGRLVLAGTVLGGVAAGPRQRGFDAAWAEDRLPLPSRLAIAYSENAGGDNRSVVIRPGAGAAPQTVDFVPGILPTDGAGFTTLLADSLVGVGGGGVGSLEVTIRGGGGITLQAGAVLETPAGGHVRLRTASSTELVGNGIADDVGFVTDPGLELDPEAAPTEDEGVPGAGRYPVGDVVVDGVIRTRGPAVTKQVAPGATRTDETIETGTAIELRGRRVLVGAAAALDARGRFVNDTVDAAAQRRRTGGGSEALALDGGAIDIAGILAVAIEAGALVDASGGGWLTADSSGAALRRIEDDRLRRLRRFALTGGAGGSIRIATNDGAAIAATGAPRIAPAVAVGLETLRIDATPAAHGSLGEQGGSFTLRTARLVLGAAPGDPAAAPASFVADTAALEAGGFERVDLAAFADLSMPAGALLAPRQHTLELAPGISAGQLPASRPGLPLEQDGRTLFQPTLLPAERRRPMTLAFATEDLSSNVLADGGLVPRLTIGEAATIAVEAGGAVALASAVRLTVAGTIDAPAGSILLQSGPADQVGGIIELAAGARLLATGADASYERRDTRPDSRRDGAVLAGGSVGVRGGRVVLRDGALIDVSGATGEVDVALADGKSERRSLFSDAGSVELASGELLVLEGLVQGRAGGPGAAGGRLVLRAEQKAGGLGILELGQTTPAAGHLPAALSADLSAPLAELNGRGLVAVDRIEGGGFGDVRLQGEDGIGFHGTLSLSVPGTLSLVSSAIGVLPDGPVAGAPVRVRLAGETVTLGAATQNTGALNPLPATTFADDAGLAAAGTLEIVAGSLIELRGELRIGGRPGTAPTTPAALAAFGTTRLDSAGDLRLVVDEDNLVVNVSTGRVENAGADLSTPGDLALVAAQIYPTSSGSSSGRLNGTFTAVPSFTLGARDIAIGRSAQPGVTPIGPLSAGGSLVLAARRIDQAGVLLAPFGRLELNAQEGVRLAAGSVTSVAGRDAAGNPLVVPYGRIEGGEIWRDPFGARLDGPPTGTLLVNGGSLDLRPDIAIESGARVDLRGGGDLVATEFVAGNEGPTDLRADAGAFALVPGLTLGRAAPYDPLFSGPRDGADRQTVDAATGLLRDPFAQGLGGPLAIGQTLTLGADVATPSGALLPAGTYTVAAPGYAVLDGAFLVQPAEGYGDLPDGLLGRGADGAAVLPGRQGARGQGQVRSSGFLILDEPATRQRARYDEVRASSFFTSDRFRDRQARDVRPSFTPRLPGDGGRLALTVEDELALAAGAVVDLTPEAGGALGEVDIASGRIAVVADTASAQAQSYRDRGFLVLGGATVGRFDSASVLLGGRRGGRGAEGTPLTVRALEVALAADLRLAELIAVAGETVTVTAGSDLSTRDDIVVGASTALRIANDLDDLPGITGGGGALLRLSTGDLVQVARDTTSSAATTGTLLVEAGASLRAGGSLNLDATGFVDGDPALGLVLGSQAIGVGRGLEVAARLVTLDADGSGPGAAFGSAARLALGGLGEVRLRAYEAVRIAADASFALTLDGASLTLDAPVIERLAGDPAAAARIAAPALTLQNSAAPASAEDAPAPAPGVGTLALEATAATGGLRDGTLTLGAGAVELRGFSLTRLGASRIVGEGRGRLAAGGALTLEAGVLQAGGGGDHTLRAGGALRLQRPLSGFVLPDLVPLGGRLRLEGASVALAGELRARAGTFEAEASAGDVTLESGAVLDLRGLGLDLFDERRFAPGGTARLVASGAVRLQAGSSLELGGNPDGLVPLRPGAELGAPEGGRLEIAAGAAALDGTIAAATPSGPGGEAVLDLVEAPGGSLDGLVALLVGAGFGDAIDLTLRGSTALVLGAAPALDGAAGLFRVATGGDLAIDAGITARTIDLAAGGRLALGAVALDARGATGGRIALAAGGDLSVAAGAALDAGGAAADAADAGGVVTLAAGGVDGAGTLAVGAGSRIAVGAGGLDGTIRLRAPRLTDTDGVRIADLAGVVLDGASVLDVEAVRRLDLDAGGLGFFDAGTGTIDASALRSFLAGDLAGYQAGLQAVETGGLGAALPVVVSPGVELAGAGDLTLSGTLDLYQSTLLGGDPVRATGAVADPRFGADDGDAATIEDAALALQRAGHLTIRAGGDLALAGSISDAFDTSPPAGAPTAAAPTNLLTADLEDGPSWSYDLVAGADLASADRLATLSAAGRAVAADGGVGGSLSVAPLGPVDATTAATAGATGLVRTGTGSIAMAARGDVVLGTPLDGPETVIGVDGITDSNARTASVYSAGRPLDPRDPSQGGADRGSRYGFGVTVAGSGLLALPFHTTTASSTTLVADADFLGQRSAHSQAFTGHGGTVAISAGRDLEGAPSTQPIAAWLPRRGTDIILPTNDSGLFEAVVGQFASQPQQTASWIHFGNFRGVGALGGGAVQLRSGRDIANVSAMVPDQVWVAGGRAVATSAAGPRVLSERAGGTLEVGAGRDLLGGVYLLAGAARGAPTEGEPIDQRLALGRIEAGGAVRSGHRVRYIPDAARDPLAPVAANALATGPLYTVLAPGSAKLVVEAKVGLAIENAIDPMRAVRRQESANPTGTVGLNGTGGLRGTFDSRSAESALVLNAIGGEAELYQAGDRLVGLVAQPSSGNRPTGYPGTAELAFLPPALRITALDGDVRLGDETAASSVLLTDAGPAQLEILAAENVLLLAPITLQDVGRQRRTAFIPDSQSIQTAATLLPAPGLYAAADEPLRIHALRGAIDTRPILGSAGLLQAVTSLASPKEARLKAGTTIANLPFSGTHYDPRDITAFEAGQDVVLSVGAVTLAGPGQLVVAAGGDVDLGLSFGLETTGDTRFQNVSGLDPAIATRVLGQPADIMVLAGIGPSVFGRTLDVEDGDAATRDGDVARLLAGYLGLEEEAFGADGVPDYLLGADGSSVHTELLRAFLGQLDPDDASLAGLDGAALWARALAPDAPAETALEPLHKTVLAAELLIEEVRAGGRESVDPASPRFASTARSYRAIGIAFSDPGSGVATPARDAALLRRQERDAERAARTGGAAPVGSDPGADSGFEGAALRGAPLWGDFVMSLSGVIARRGGDTIVLAPYGAIQAGAATRPATAAEDVDDPSLPPFRAAGDEGLWSSYYGDVLLLAHDDVAVNFSRIIAAGPPPGLAASPLRRSDVAIWSSWGDIQAGAGATDAITLAPDRIVVSPDGVATIEPGGIAGGSGIAATGEGSIDLFAPGGIVDAGEAGIRTNANLTIAAIAVSNAQSIEVGGVQAGTAAAGAAAVTPTNAAAAASEAVQQQIAETTRQQAERSQEPAPLLITGRFLGYY